MMVDKRITTLVSILLAKADDMAKTEAAESIQEIINLHLQNNYDEEE